jgi:hypothetical protein
MAIRAVILDIGGVLEVNPPTGWQERWAARLGLDPDEFERRLGPIFDAGSRGTAPLPTVERFIATVLALDERSLRHQAFINAYLRSKGQKEVSLERFRRLAPSAATGGGSKKRLTNLMSLNVDTSWYLRYRAVTNPDFAAMFGQAVTIREQPVIAVSDTDTPPTLDAPVPVPSDAAHQRLQAIANSAGFHFAMIEQGGSSLYTTMALKVTSLEVLRVVRPTLDSLAGARAAVNALTNDGLFTGQGNDFFSFIKRLAREADAAERRLA